MRSKGDHLDKSNTSGDETCTLRLETHPFKYLVTERCFVFALSFLYISDEMKETPKGTEGKLQYC